jgi:site-specific DNA recombinase
MQQPQTICKIVLYARVSSEEQKEGQTIDSQIEELRRHAADRGWTTVDVYKDDGWSGGLLARPELDRLRDDASKSKFEAVLVNDVDRLARDVAHLGVIKRGLERLGIALIFRKLPAETSPMRNLMVNILGSFAEFEKELIADRTRRGRRHKAEIRKQFVGGLAPYGYSYVEKSASAGEGHLQINPEEAVVVQRVYGWVDKEGLSARAVVRRLNSTGIRPRFGAGQWAKSSVLRILRNETYAGVWYYNKYEAVEPKSSARAPRKYRRSLKTSTRLRERTDWIAVPLAEELVLVTREIWGRVQTRINQNVAFSPRNSRHPYLLRGLVRCAGCHARIVGEPGHRETYYYRCHRRCHRVSTVQERDLDGAVWKALEEAILNPELIVKSVMGLQSKAIREADTGNSPTIAAAKALDQIRAEEMRILEAYRLTIISANQLDQELRGLASRKRALEAADQPPHEQIPIRLSQEEIRQRIGGFCQQISRKLASLNREQKQQLLRYIVEEIEFDGSMIHIRAMIPSNENQEWIAASSRTVPQMPSSLHAELDQGDLAGTTSGESDLNPNDKCIEDTASCRSGRNPSSDGGIETTALRHSGRNLDTLYDDSRHTRLCFELTNRVERDHSKAKAASLANLREAMIARRPDVGGSTNTSEAPLS